VHEHAIHVGQPAFDVGAIAHVAIVAVAGYAEVSVRRVPSGAHWCRTDASHGPFSANRIQDHHDNDDRNRGLRKRITKTLSSPRRAIKLEALLVGG
jgi:hypothetical protein